MITITDSKRPKQSDADALLPEPSNSTRTPYISFTGKLPLNVLTEAFLPPELTSVLDIHQKGLEKIPLPQDSLPFVGVRATSCSPRNRTTEAQNCAYCLAKVAHPRLGRGESYACGYKPYRCEICNYSTVTKGNLAIHEQSDKHLNNVQDYDHQQRLQYLKSLEESTTGVLTEFKNDKLTGATSHSLEKESKRPFTANQKMPPEPDVQGAPTSEIDLYATFKGRSRFLPPVINSFKQQNGLKTNGRPLTKHSTQFLAATVPTKNTLTMQGESFLGLPGDSDLPHLPETMSQPLVCQICSAFCTDNPEALIEHVERSRIPLDLEAANRQVTTHADSMWHCRVCTYRSALKANFQLHCKTEKHAQRLSLIVHIWEGLSAANSSQDEPAGGLCGQQGGSTANLSSALVKCLQIISSSSFTTTSSSSSSTIKNTSSSTMSSSSAVPCQASTFVQLRCLACGFFSGSVHKFRVHCQMLSHVRFARLFSYITHKRDELRAALVAFTQVYVDHLKTMVPSLTVGQTAAAYNASEQNAVSVVTSTDTTAAVQNLLTMVAEVKVVYDCRSCLQAAPTEAAAENFSWFSVAEVLRHCHSEEHQRQLQGFEEGVSSELHTEEVEILWELAGKKGTADQLPALITIFLMSSTGPTEGLGLCPDDPKVSTTGTKLDPVTDASSVFVVPDGVEPVSDDDEKFSLALPGGPTPSVCESGMVIQGIGLQEPWQLQKEATALSCCEAHPTERDERSLNSKENESLPVDANYSQNGNGTADSQTQHMLRASSAPPLQCQSKSSAEILWNQRSTSCDGLNCTRQNQKSPENAMAAVERSPALLPGAGRDSMHQTPTLTPGHLRSEKRTFAAMEVATEFCDRLSLGHRASNQSSINIYENLARLSAEILKVGEVVPNKFQPSTRPHQPRGISISDLPVPKSPAELLSRLDVNGSFCWILENWIHSQLPEHLPVNHDFLLEIVALVLEILAQKSSEEVFQSGLRANKCPVDLSYLHRLQQAASCGTCSQCNPKRDFLLSSSLGLHAILHHSENTPQALLNLTVEQIEVVASEVFNYLSDDHINPPLSAVDNSAWLTKFQKEFSQPGGLFSPAGFATLPRSSSLSTVRDGSVSSSATTTQAQCQARKGRTRLDSSQLSILWANFNLNSSPSDEKMAEICLQTGLKEKVVKHWFRNTLFKERQRSKDSPYNFSIPPTTNLDLEKYERTGKVETWPAIPIQTVTKAGSMTKTDACEVAYVENPTAELRNDQRSTTSTELGRSCTTSPNHQSCGIREMKREYNEVEEVMMASEAEEGNRKSSGKRPSPSSTTSSEKGSPKKRHMGGKRIRTAISQSQQILLSRFFHNDPNPSRRQMDIIAATVSLPKRVVQVWFQNARSRERKLGYPLSTGSLCRQALPKPSPTLSGSLPTDNLSPAASSPSVLISGPLCESQLWDSKPSTCEAQKPEHPQQLRYHPTGPAVDDLWRSVSESIPPVLQQFAFPYSTSTTNADFQHFPRQIDVRTDAANPTAAGGDALRNAGSLFPQVDWPSIFSQLLKQQLSSGCQPGQLSSWQPGLAAAAVETAALESQSDSPLDLSQRSHRRSCDSDVGAGRQSSPDDPSLLEEQRRTARQSPMEWSPGLKLSQSTLVGGELIECLEKQQQQQQQPSGSQTPNKFEATSTAPSQTRRNRTSISCPQARFMQTIYAYHKTPSIFECDRVGQAIGLRRRVVQVWFQNQRAKEKKMARISALGMQPSPNTSSACESSLNDHHGDLVTLANGASECKLCGVLIIEATEESAFGDASRGGGLAAAMDSDRLIDHLFSTMHLSNLLNSCNQSAAEKS